MDPAAFIHTFPRAEVHRLIRRARRAAAFPEDGPEGWHKSPVDPCSVLATFLPLQLKPGYTLRAYAFREGGNGNAFVYTCRSAHRSPNPRSARPAQLKM